MSHTLKRMIGKTIWDVSANSRFLRRRLSSLGLRTRQTWFAGRPASAFLPDGKRIALTGIEHSYMTFLLHWLGWIAYEPITVLLLRELIKDKQSYLHVGANIGYLPLIAAADKPDLKVAGFEPNPKVFETFKNNVATNRLPVAAEAKAVSDQAGTLEFFLSPSDMSGSLDPRFQKQHAGVVQVPVVSLDEYLAAHPMPPARLIRIIVEGLEPRVLRGAVQAMQDPGAEFIIAVVRDAPPDMMALLREHGFSCYNINDRGLEAGDAIRFTRRGDYNFLDWLVTRRSPAEVRAISDRLMPFIRQIDMPKTSMYRPDWNHSRPYA
jgi:FkbM family methyltransferase